MQSNNKEQPVGGNELARAFAWKVADLAYDEGEIALFLPAMTLFDTRAAEFRERFFERLNVRSVANFSNLAEVISAGRFRVPSAAFFYTPHSGDVGGDRFVKAFSPLVANQEVTRPESKGERIESWCIVVNESEIRDIPYGDIVGGSGLPWKIAAWGSHNDVRLLRRLTRQFADLGTLQSDGVLVISEGPALRGEPVEEGEDKTEYQNELLGSSELDTSALARLRHVFRVPEMAVRPCEKHYLRLRAGRRTLTVCRGPHVILSAARNFAIYTDEYLVVPSRQIGIVSPSDDRALLKAISLFLSSDFALYHQLFTSTEFGVKRDRATLEALLKMPCPLKHMTTDQLKRWVALHDQLVKTSPRRVGEAKPGSLFRDDDNLDELLVQLNDLVFDSLGMTERERSLVTDFVHIRLELNDGKVGRPAVENPSPNDLKRYANRLRKELDDYLGPDSSYRHAIEVIYDESSGMICVDLVKSAKAVAISVLPADSPMAKALYATRDALREETGQWVYFNRDLRLHSGMKTYIFKPMQRFHWTESQAMVAASELIAETISADEVAEGVKP
jgi:hypothetical protein